MLGAVEFGSPDVEEFFVGDGVFDEAVGLASEVEAAVGGIDGFADEENGVVAIRGCGPGGGGGEAARGEEKGVRKAGECHGWAHELPFDKIQIDAHRSSVCSAVSGFKARCLE